MQHIYNDHNLLNKRRHVPTVLYPMHIYPGILYYNAYKRQQLFLINDSYLWENLFTIDPIGFDF